MLFFYQVHRLVVVDNDDHVIGVISLSDILKELVLKPSRKRHLQSPVFISRIINIFFIC